MEQSSRCRINNSWQYKQKSHVMMRTNSFTISWKLEVMFIVLKMIKMKRKIMKMNTLVNDKLRIQ